MTEITDLGVKAIRDGVATGEFSAVEAAEAFNANVAAASALNAFIVATPEAALDAAQGQVKPAVLLCAGAQDIAAARDLLAAAHGNLRMAMSRLANA